MSCWFYKTKQTMSCLVQQLFRQKIGLDIDGYLVATKIWPLLFQEKHAPRILLQDIQLIRQADENGDAEERHSVIKTRPGRRHGMPSDSHNVQRFTSTRISHHGREDSRSLRCLCQIDIVNRFRSLVNPIILMGPGYREYAEYKEHGALGWLPYMNNILILEERSERDFLKLHRRKQVLEFGTTLDMTTEEWADHVKEQRIIENDNINSYIECIIRNKSKLKWEVMNRECYGKDPQCSLSFTC